METFITAHPIAAAILAFMSAHFGHMTWAQVKQFGEFWESMRGWQGLIRFWKTGNPNPEPIPATYILKPTSIPEPPKQPTENQTKP